MKKILVLSLILLVFSGCTNNDELVVENKPILEDTPILEPLDESQEEVEISVVEDEEKEEPVVVDTVDSVVEIADELNLDVPFAMQAPFSNWDMPYQEMCEEAALVLSSKYFGEEPLTKQIMDQELTKLREWEELEWGVYTDSTVAEIKEMGETVLNLDIEISEDVSVENIKENLNKGYLVLAPTAGRELNNPFFKQPGPLYHIIVIRGYNKNNFITNDVGIGKGEAYQYPYHILLNAVHDLPIVSGEIFRPYDEDVSEFIKEEEMLNGEKRILIIKGIKQPA